MNQEPNFIKSNNKGSAFLKDYWNELKIVLNDKQLEKYVDPQKPNIHISKNGNIHFNVIDL